MLTNKTSLVISTSKVNNELKKIKNEITKIDESKLNSFESSLYNDLGVLINHFKIKNDDEYEMIINVQGDEPLIDPEDINSLIDLFDEEECDIGTLASRITNQDELHSADTVKVVLSDFEDEVADALYFSRAPIPYMRDEDPQNWLDHHIYYKHIGLYAFAPEVLESIKALGESSLEIAEKSSSSPDKE